MSMKIITGSTGSTHVTSNNDGELQQGIFGTGLVVLGIGSKLKATLIDNNTIQIDDGDLVFQGRHALIEPNTNETLNIETGSIGNNRIDLIVAHYELDTTTGYETIELRVIKGANSTGTPVAPAITEGNIRTGSKVAEAVLYEVKINGISIASVTPKATTIEPIVNSVNANAIKADKVMKALEFVNWDASTGTLTVRQMV